MTTKTKNIRCAIYTRKSSEEGLEQEFNSLDAQRESCTAYIASQRHEGWEGKWMGGTTPTGYDIVDKNLVINEEEAKTIHYIFQQYIELKSVNLLKSELDADGYKTKIRTTKTGKTTGGKPFSKGNLYRVLQNYLYIGYVSHKENHYVGEHDAIIDEELFNQVQELVAKNRIKQKNSEGAKSPCLLAGKLFDDKDNYMTPKHSRTRKRHYRYYTSQAIIQSRPQEAGSLPNIPAGEIEQLVKSEIYGFLKDANKLQPYLSELAISGQKELLEFIANLQFDNAENERIFIRSIISKIILSDHNISITLCTNNLIKSLQSLQQNSLIFHYTSLETEHPITLKRNAKLAKSRDGSKVIAGSIASGCNMQLIKAITRSFLWHEQLINGEIESAKKIQEREQINSNSYFFKIMRLRFWAPNIIELIC